MTTDLAKSQFADITVEYVKYIKLSMTAFSNLLVFVKELLTNDTSDETTYVSTINDIVSSMVDTLSNKISDSEIDIECKRRIAELVNKCSYLQESSFSKAEIFLTFLSRFDRKLLNQEECIAELDVIFTEYKANMIKLLESFKEL